LLLHISQQIWVALVKRNERGFKQDLPGFLHAELGVGYVGEQPDALL
jgi:hypothetical protein